MLARSHAGINSGASAAAERRRLYVIFAAGVVLRLFRLSSQSFWYDEAVSADLSHHDFLSLLTGRVRDLGNPPLHNLVLHGWTRLFGDSDASLRFVSALAGSLTLPLSYAVSRRLIGQRAALVATALFALSPFHVYFSQENRTYSLVTMITVFGTYALLRALEPASRPRFWILYGLSTFLSIYAHYYAVFLTFGQVVYVARFYRRDRRALLGFAASMMGAAFAYAIWLPALVAQLTTQGNLRRAPNTWYLHGLATPLVFGTGTTLVWKGLLLAQRVVLAVLATGAFGVAALAGVRGLARERRSLALLLLWLLFPVGLPLLISALLFPFYTVRYGLLSIPAFFFLVAAGLTTFSSRWRLVLEGIMGLGVMVSLATYFSTRVKNDWRAAASYVEAHAVSRDLLLFDADFNELSYARYAHNRGERRRLLQSLTANEHTGAIPGVTHAGEPVRDLSPEIATHDRIWIIASDPRAAVESSIHRLIAKSRKPSDRAQFRGIDIELWTR
jgi:mannosyltransferase